MEEMETDPGEEIILEIDEEVIKCNKQQLMDNSDYFKIMFGGNFVEHTKKVVKLEGVDVKTMKLLLFLLWDKSVHVEDEDVPAILEASSMFQFLEIKEMYTQQLIERLCPKNCIQTWLIAEKLDIETLYLKAKTMALIEFTNIKELDVLRDLNLHQLYLYLANTSLLCNDEMDVFEVCMKWWYNNSQKLLQETTMEQVESIKNETFLHLLSCLDFKRLTDRDIKSIMTHSDLTENIKTFNVLNCVLSLRHNEEVKMDRNVLNEAKKLVKSKSRYFKRCPCILVSNIKIESGPTYVEKDVYKRKRYCVNIAEPDESSLVGVYYDARKANFAKFFDINQPNCTYLDGFRILGHKEFVFLFGGEHFVLVKGYWNKHIWMYDTIRERWTNKTTIPNVRRHFQACICDDYLYIIGGTGNFRIVKDNMFWYNYKKNEWSKEIILPCYRQFKSCCLDNRILLLDLNGSCGYLFERTTSSWKKLNILDDQQLMSCFPKKYVVYAYDGHVYIRGDHLIKLKKIDDNLRIVECKPSNFLSCDQVESVLCNNVVYLLYKHRCSEIGTFGISLEKYYIELETSEFIFKDVATGTIMKVDDNEYLYRMSTVIFEYFHYSLSKNDEFVNDVLPCIKF